MANRRSATDGTRRPIEGGKQAIACGVDFVPAKQLELPACHRQIAFQQFAPLAVAEHHGALGGSHDVHEQHGGQFAIGLGGRLGAGKEGLDLVDDGAAVTDPWHMVDAGQFDEPGVRYLLRESSCLVNADDAFVRAMKNKCRHLDRRQHAARIDLPVHLPHRDCRTGAVRGAEIARKATGGTLIIGDARRPHRKVDTLRRAPVPLGVLQNGGPALVGPALGVVRDPGLLGVGAVEDQRFGSLRIGGGKEDRHRPAFGDAEKCSLFRPGIVHDGLDVVHALFEGEDLRGPIRHPRAALVEQNQPTKRRQTTEEACALG